MTVDTRLLVWLNVGDGMCSRSCTTEIVGNFHTIRGQG